MMSLKERVIGLISDIEARSEKIKPDIFLDNKTILDALNEQPKLEFEWRRMAANAKSLVQECEIERSEAFSLAVQNVLHNSHYKLGSTELKIHAESEANYIAARRLEIKMIRSCDIAKSVVDTIDSRKYVLNNLSRLIVAGAEGHIL